MEYNREEIVRRIESVAKSEMELSDDAAHDVAFHMTDWLNNLAEWVNFCSNPELINDDQLCELMLRFLVHVPNHVAAASKLFADVPVTDIFNVGATTVQDD